MIILRRYQDKRTEWHKMREYFGRQKGERIPTMTPHTTYGTQHPNVLFFLKWFV